LVERKADYNDIGSDCHMKPRQKESDLSIGQYPQPLNLTLASKDHAHEQGDFNAIAQQQFWLIKYGIMASDITTYGPTHDEESIWAVEAFLKKLTYSNEIQCSILSARQ
jgi:hypothetical protein